MPTPRTVHVRTFGTRLQRASSSLLRCSSSLYFCSASSIFFFFSARPGCALLSSSANLIQYLRRCSCAWTFTRKKLPSTFLQTAIVRNHQRVSERSEE